MRTKAPRFIVATIAVALVSLGGFSGTAEAAKEPVQQRTGWCC